MSYSVNAFSIPHNSRASQASSEGGMGGHGHVPPFSERGWGTEKENKKRKKVMELKEKKRKEICFFYR